MATRIIFRPGTAERAFYTLPETMAHFRVSRHLVLRWIADGHLAVRKIGDRQFVTVDSVKRAEALFYGDREPGDGARRAVG